MDKERGRKMIFQFNGSAVEGNGKETSASFRGEGN